MKFEEVFIKLRCPECGAETKIGQYDGVRTDLDNGIRECHCSTCRKMLYFNPRKKRQVRIGTFHQALEVFLLIVNIAMILGIAVMIGILIFH